MQQDINRTIPALPLASTLSVLPLAFEAARYSARGGSVLVKLGGWGAVHFGTKAISYKYG
jgi:hypothetical protein